MLAAAAFASHSSARMVHQDASHGLRGDREEVCAVPIRNGLATHQPHAQFVHDGVRFERMVTPFVAQQVRGNLTQMRVDQREQVIARLLVTAAPSGEPSRDLGR